MDYNDFNDFELIYNIKENSEEANEILYEKYKGLIKKIVDSMTKNAPFLGIDLDDLMQEGLIALNLAIKSYDENSKNLFYTYAKTVIRNKLATLITKSNAEKNFFLNSSLPFEIEDNNKQVIYEKVLNDNRINPENILINEEGIKTLINKINKKLTDFESQVFNLKISGFSYNEIAKILNKNKKSIDNTIQRIKIKAKKAINSY